MNEVEVGQRYEVALTTTSGFYRYRMGDVIEVEETALNSKGTLRVRFSGGWTSVQSGGGVQILERCDAEDDR